MLLPLRLPGRTSTRSVHGAAPRGQRRPPIALGHRHRRRRRRRCFNDGDGRGAPAVGDAYQVGGRPKSRILAALRADASDGFVPLAAVASSGAEPAEAAARGYRLVFQRQFVDELLQMRDDIAAALTREIVRYDKAFVRMRRRVSVS